MISKEPVVYSPRHLLFWRSVFGIMLVLLLQHPRLYANVPMFIGLWLGTASISFLVSALLVGLGLLYFTEKVRGRGWNAFLILAWVVAGLQLAGEWLLPEFVTLVPVNNQSGLFTGLKERNDLHFHAEEIKDAEFDGTYKGAETYSDQTQGYLKSGKIKRFDITRATEKCLKQFSAKFGTDHRFVPAPAFEYELNQNGCFSVDHTCVKSYIYLHGVGVQVLVIDFELPESDALYGGPAPYCKIARIDSPSEEPMVFVTSNEIRKINEDLAGRSKR